ncbi:MAG: DUF2007 domain-containing protein [Bacteroidales bacterium]
MMLDENSNWVKIYSSSLVHEVEIFRGMLEENGIEAVIINKKDSAYLFGEAELYVTADDAFDAKQLISNKDLE